MAQVEKNKQIAGEIWLRRFGAPFPLEKPEGETKPAETEPPNSTVTTHSNG
jgi:hypothetical protein